MSYNDGGCCGGSGFSMPFAFTMPWGNGNNDGFGANGMFGWLMSILFFSLFGFGGWGGGFGGRGIMPGMFPGAVPGAVGGNIAAEAAAYVGQQNTADRVASIATGVDAVAGIATANGVKIETVKDAVTNGFYANQRDLCELGSNIAMTAMNNQNATTALLNDMRFANAQCCCDTKQLIQSSFCDLRHQMQVDKCETLQAVAASEARITARMDAAEKTAMLEKISALQEQKAGLKAQIDLQNQTNQLAALIQQQRGCAPCGPYSPCSPCGNPCLDGLQRAVTDAFGNRISEILFPPTTTTAAA